MAAFLHEAIFTRGDRKVEVILMSRVRRWIVETLCLPEVSIVSRGKFLREAAIFFALKISYLPSLIFIFTAIFLHLQYYISLIKIIRTMEDSSSLSSKHQHQLCTKILGLDSRGRVLTIKSPRRGSLEDDPYEISIDYPAALPRIHDAHSFYQCPFRNHFDPNLTQLTLIRIAHALSRLRTPPPLFPSTFRLRIVSDA